MLLLAAGLTGLTSATRAQTVQPAATGPAPTQAQEAEVLRQRVADFWFARVNRDFKAQWDLLEPRFKGRVPAQAYAGGRGSIQYIAYQVEEADIQGPFAEVKVKVLAQPISPRLRDRRVASVRAVTVSDKWVRVKGVWYRRMDRAQEAPEYPTP